MSVGIDHGTARFATASILLWWREMGTQRFPRATELLITADGGGSHSSRNRPWKVSLQDLADELRPRTLPESPHLRRVVEPFVKARARKEIDFKFTIIDSEEVFAFSQPVGHVYLSRAILEWIGEDEDASLEFFLAHEIAHIDLRHALRCLRDPKMSRLDADPLMKLHFLITPRGFPDPLDFEADAWACRHMKQFGRSRLECLSFLRKFGDHAAHHGFKNGRIPVKASPRTPILENHYRAHPAAWGRENRLKASMPTDPPGQVKATAMPARHMAPARPGD